MTEESRRHNNDLLTDDELKEVYVALQMELIALKILDKYLDKLVPQTSTNTEDGEKL